MMKCTNCGQEINEHDRFCGNCGYKVMPVSKNCPNCGAILQEGARVCAYCGYEIPVQSQPIIHARSRIVAGLLGIVLGGMGVHNFYLGYSSKGFIQICMFFGGLFTFGLSALIAWIWGFVEGVLLLSGSIERDGDDHLLK